MTSLKSGAHLGPYEILSAIGAGGMGEVFRARDTRLDRNVAIKVLPAAFAQDAQLRLRFEREARLISQLSHPHICTLHDVGIENGVSYLVMELLDGETLADRLRRGPLPIENVLRYGIEIADALDVAHRAGLIHRDLKPGNIMLTKNGAKLLDFGLARQAVTGRDSAPDESTYQQEFVTTGGVILGTLQYMAPEQLGGEELDARTDIFALGAVLYEMATGKRAFQGSSKTSLIAAIVTAEPQPISDLQPLTPPAFEHVVKKCLSKDRESRWQSVYDVAEELRWISEAGSAAGVASPIVVRKRKRQRLNWLAAIVAFALVSAAGAWLASAKWERAHQEASVYRLTVATPPGAVLGFMAGRMAFSPDGRLLTYASYGHEGSMLLVRKLSEIAWHPLEGTSGASSPFWSPDGRQIGYLARGSLWKIAADGSGAPEEITKVEIRGRLSGTWGRDGTILFAIGGRLFRVSSSGGEAVGVKAFPEKVQVSIPEFLPDSRHYLCSAGTDDNNVHYVVDLESKEPPKRIVTGDNNASYGNGYLFFVRAGTLYAQPFDPDSFVLSGVPKAIAKVQGYTGEPAYFSVAGDNLVYLPQGSEVHTELQRVDRAGKLVSSVAQPGFFFSPRISHDGSRVAVDQSVTTGPGDIYLFDVATGAPSRLTFSPDNESAPVWGPGDAEITYYEASHGKDVLMRKRIAGGAPALEYAGAGATFSGDWSTDGKWILALANEPPAATLQVRIISVADKKPVGPLIPGTSPRFSPDGHWFAYCENESGTGSDVFVQPFPPNGSKWQVSTDGGWMPVWRRDGKALYFVTTAGKMMECLVNVAADGAFSAQTPQPLFNVALREGSSIFSQFDVFPDGTFLVNRIPETASTPMTVILHWKEALDQ